MHSSLIKINKGYKKIEFGLLVIAGLAVLFAMFLTTVDVFMRNVFNDPITGVTEILNITLIVIVALGFSYVQGIKANIIIEIATSNLPPFYKNLLDWCGYLVGLIVISIITWQSCINTVSSFIDLEHTSGLIKIPLWPSKLLLAIGMVTLNMRLLLDVLLMVFHLKHKSSVEYSEESISVKQ